MKLLLPAPVAPLQPDALSPLEEGLRGPGDAQLRSATLARLADLAQQVRASMSAGVSRQRYDELAALLDACLAAQEVLTLGPTQWRGSTMGASVRVS